MSNEGIVVFYHTNFEEKVCFLWHRQDRSACNTKTVNLDGKSNGSTLVPNHEEANWSLINHREVIYKTAKPQGESMACNWGAAKERLGSAATVDFGESISFFFSLIRSANLGCQVICRTHGLSNPSRYFN